MKVTAARPLPCSIIEDEIERFAVLRKGAGMSGLSAAKSGLILGTVCGLLLAVAWAGEKEKPAEQPLDPKIQELLNKAVEDTKIAESRNRFLADHHTKVGIELFNANRFEEAKTEFEKAIQYDKNNADAQSYLRRTDSLLGMKHGTWANVVEQEVNRTLIARQIAKVEMENRFQAAKADFQAGKFDEAITGFERVREIVKWIEPYADVSQWKGSTNDYLERAQKGKLEKAEEEAKRRRDEALKIALFEQMERTEFMRNRIETLLGQARRYYARGEFDKARDIFREVVEIDPENKEALQQAEAAQMAGVQAWGEEIRKKNLLDTTVAWDLVAQFSIPQSEQKPYQVIWYDVDKWFDRVLKRERVGRLTEEEEDWKKAIRKKLDQKVSFDFVDTPLEDVVQFLRHLTDMTIVLDPKALEGKDKNTVTLKVTEMELDKALEWILKLVDLKYTLKDNAVFITEPANAQGDAIRQLYDVTDLTLEIRDFKGDLRHLRTRTGTSISGEGGGGQDEEIFGQPEEKKEEDVFTGKSLVDFIKQTIAPGTWAADIAE